MRFKVISSSNIAIANYDYIIVYVFALQDDSREAVFAIKLKLQ